MIQAGLPHLAVMGTMHEVGYWEGAITEDTPTNPTSLYGIAKNSLRQITYLLADGTNTKVDWLRAYYILGDDKKSNSLFAKIVKWEEKEKKVFRLILVRTNMILSVWMNWQNKLQLCQHRIKFMGIINCCTGKPETLANKVEEFILSMDLR